MKMNDWLHIPLIFCMMTKAAPSSISIPGSWRSIFQKTVVQQEMTYPKKAFFLQQKGCMYHDKKAWWRDIFMIQLQSFISHDCDFPWDASKSLLFPAPNSKFLSLTYDLHLLTCISVLIGIRLANKGCWKSAFI